MGKLRHYCVSLEQEKTVNFTEFSGSLAARGYELVKYVGKHELIVHMTLKYKIKERCNRKSRVSQHRK